MNCFYLFKCSSNDNFGQGFGITEPQDPFPPVWVGGVYTPLKGAFSSIESGGLFKACNIHSIIPAKQDIEELFDTLDENRFSQCLDMKSAVVTTKGKWFDYQIDEKIFLSRSIPNMGVLKVALKPENEEELIKHKFHQIIQKDPRIKYETLDVNLKKERLEILGKIHENGYDFRNQGLFEIIQLSKIEIIQIKTII